MRQSVQNLEDRLSDIKVPSKADWGNLKDLAVAKAYKTYGRKTVAEATPLFVRNPIERSDELLFASAKVFNYYVTCFIPFLISDESRGESDAASTFLRLIRNRLNKPGASEVAKAILQIKPAIDKIAGRQAFYEASTEIYGSFLKIKNEIDAALVHFEGKV